MTKLLKFGIKAIMALPPETQDSAGALLLKIAGAASPQYHLTSEQIEDVKLAVAEMDRSEFATNEEIEEVWRSFG